MTEGILLALGVLIVLIPYFDYKWGTVTVKDVLRKIKGK